MSGYMPHSTPIGRAAGGNESRIPGQQDWVCPICGIKVAAHDKEQRKACLRKMRDQRTDPGRAPHSAGGDTQ